MEKMLNFHFLECIRWFFQDLQSALAQIKGGSVAAVGARGQRLEPAQYLFALCRGVVSLARSTRVSLMCSIGMKMDML